MTDFPAPSQHLPRRSDGFSVAAMLFAGLCVLAAFGTTRLMRGALTGLGVYASAWEIVFGLTIAGSGTLFWPALRSLVVTAKARAARARNDIVELRIETAAAKDHAFITFGWGAFALCIFGFISFVLTNDAAVGKTFFLLPLIQAKWWLVTKQFLLNNLFIFVATEILVLVWGLMVALARLIPGKAGRPIRALAIIYCDVFRGIPAIVTLYLIGFGIPTSGLSDLIVPHIVGLFIDLSAMSVAEVRAVTRIPVSWWCVLALTLTYGAYVAEVYRAGIESIHWSQVSAARSLGLSYIQTMRYVIVPQAVRRIMAPLLNDFIGLQKDTALVQVVGVVDAFNQSRIIAANAFNLSAVTIVAILFVLITIPQARFVDKLTERDNARMRAGG
ncbi:amino acid ABC transporter permease [Mesorhizobium escarrei]|uniref:Amino acid ABC transporter permease n=1 Tax=Mesorhizobium escarrei TaxID=666018 RepID=A0ABN8K5J5_9HYPH|nr:amino acid ABC transporter permease [Mesorhizobium escarrei]CAH2404594.1 Amino acid ABC transporter permease [Mesorhizobium escarrei]